MCPLHIPLLDWAPEPRFWGPMTLLERRLHVSTFPKKVLLDLPGGYLVTHGETDSEDLLLLLFIHSTIHLGNQTGCWVSHFLTL